VKVITRDHIEEVLPTIELMPAIEDGFVAYSQGRAVVPPVGELLLDGGDVHIKYGYIKDEDHYVIKIASGFYGNPALGLPSGNGLMLLHRQRTGELACVLFDEGFLTDVRTAVAGAIAARYLAPEVVGRIGIVGTGTQARLQLLYLDEVVECKDVLVWGRGDEQLERYRADMSGAGYDVVTTRDTADIMKSCDVIVTTTPATTPLLSAEGLRPGMHITAVGSDTPHKQELDAAILSRADVVVADSVEQCLVRGEIYKAISVGALAPAQLVELGHIIDGQAPGRTSSDEVIVADLTGVAVQDIKIAEAVFQAVDSHNWE
jgi:ornithine cyclodeaminase